MSNIQYAVCHLQRGSGNASGIERKIADGKVYIPDNVDKTRTHLNWAFIQFPTNALNRSDAVQYHIVNAGLYHKVRKKQTKTVHLSEYLCRGDAGVRLATQPCHLNGQVNPQRYRLRRE